jgi:UDP-N-acetylmuramate dehydrogenase
MMALSEKPPVSAAIRGRILTNAPLAPFTWFRVGGPAEILFRPADAEDLATFLRGHKWPAPLVIGAASNLLIRDGGVPGPVIRLGGAFAAIETGPDWIRAGAGALDATVSQVAAEAGRTGLEFLSGIPGTIGGAVFMNAGCYGSEVRDRLLSAEVMLACGTVRSYDAGKLGLSYRHSGLQPGAIILSATFRAEPGDPAAIAARMAEIEAARQESQPLRTRTGGSTFANPEGHKAWQLIDEAGCRGLVIGDAQVSQKHCNFLINRGSATAADIEALGEEVRRRVADKSGIDLRWEIRRVGVPA